MEADQGENIMNQDTDTEGHMPLKRGQEPAGENDTVEDAAEDTEGHGKNSRIEDAGGEDTEGHRQSRR